MHQAPFDERLDFYRYTEALTDLCHAREILVQLNEHGPDAFDEWHWSVLWMAFYGYYAKPFLQRREGPSGRGLRILSDDVVPSKFRERHQLLMDLRNMMMAHTDWDGLCDLDGSHLNMIAVVINPDGSPRFSRRFDTPQGVGVVWVLELIDAVRDELDRRGGEIWGKWVRHISPSEPGAYRLNINPDDNSVLVPLPLSALTPTPPAGTPLDG